MVASTDSSAVGVLGRQTGVGRLSLLAMLLGMLLLVVGGGCGLEQNESSQDSDERPKGDFVTKPAVIYPGIFKDEAQNNRTKPGHWVLGSYRVTANNFDATGRMLASGMSSLNKVALLGNTNYFAESARPFSLTTGQEKNLEVVLFLPRLDESRTSSRVRFSLQGPSGLEMVGGIESSLFLKPHQFHFLILAGEQDKYSYVRALDCTQLPIALNESSYTTASSFYKVVFPTPGQPLPLGPSAMTWTTTAYVLWDNQDPDALTSAQQQALIDWLHFGGQIIINGPGSMGNLAQSFLGPYLPASFGEVNNLAGSDFSEFNTYWATPMRLDKARRWELNIPRNVPMLGVDLKLQPGANYVIGTGGLVAERRLGRGRIVLTGFSLSDPRFAKWEGCSSFFHNALMGKPPRAFQSVFNDLVTCRFIKEKDCSIFTPMVGSTLRFISRDLGRPVMMAPALLIADDKDPDFLESSQFKDRGFPTQWMDDNAGELNAKNHLYFGGFGSDALGGTGVWNDEFGVSAAARENLSQMAGINPPKPDFVLKMLGGYLLVLVPLNWLFFRLLGRVEWAWLAMPVISILGAVTVIRLAALDIGFLRSQTQIGFLELHGGYSRGHLTEYSALYSSLSTIYTINFNEPFGLALPLASKSKREFEGGERGRAFQLDQGTEFRARNFLVNSNSTGMLHCETMTDVGGTIAWSAADGTDHVVNTTRINLQGAGVIRRLLDGNVQISWLGDFAAGSRRQLHWRDAAPDNWYEPWYQQECFVSRTRVAREIWSELPRSAGDSASVELTALLQSPRLAGISRPLREAIVEEIGLKSNVLDEFAVVSQVAFEQAYRRVACNKTTQLNLGDMFDVIAEQLLLSPGEMRLIGYTEEPISRTVMEPQATEIRQANLVVVHLHPHPFRQLQPDCDTIHDHISRSSIRVLIDGFGDEDGIQQNDTGDEGDTEQDEP